MRKEQTLLEVLNEFQSARSHLAIVCDKPDQVKRALKNNQIIPPNVHMAGCIALEDVLEKLIQEPIYDEKDVGSGSSVREKLVDKQTDRPSLLRSLLDRSMSNSRILLGRKPPE